MRAAILTIGNELVSGDTVNSNAAWLAQRLERLGVKVVISAAVPDEPEQIVDFIRRESPRVDHLLVTGGLGGTPDDVTREAVAIAFEVEPFELKELAEELRARFTGDPDYVTRWAALPQGSRPLDNPLGGAPGFVIENTWVLPGLPSEMMAMFDLYAAEFDGGRPIETWRRLYQTRESRIASALEHATRNWPDVSVGSYPSFLESGPEVEVVLKSADPQALADAAAWLTEALDTLA